MSSMTSEIKMALIIGGLITAGITFCITDKNRNEARKLEAAAEKKRLELYKAEQEAKLPPEYWSAKEAKTKADAEIEKAKIEAETQLELDKRDREDAEKEAIREFEKDAPDAYWEHKRFEEAEKTKREQICLEDARATQKANTERDIAKRNAEALETGIRSLERAMTNRTFWNNTNRVGLPF